MPSATTSKERGHVHSGVGCQATGCRTSASRAQTGVVGERGLCVMLVVSHTVSHVEITGAASCSEQAPNAHVAHCRGRKACVDIAAQKPEAETQHVHASHKPCTHWPMHPAGSKKAAMPQPTKANPKSHAAAVQLSAATTRQGPQPKKSQRLTSTTNSQTPHVHTVRLPTHAPVAPHM